MRVPKKQKENWVTAVHLGLRSTFEGLGFRKAGKRKYKKKTTCGEQTYILVTRHPRYSDDPHRLYVCGAIGTLDTNCRKAVSYLNGTEPDVGYSTIGGNIGLFSKDSIYKDIHMDSEADINRVVAEFAQDLESIAVPFWEHMATPEMMLNEIDKDSHYAFHLVHGKFTHLALVLMVRGKDAALAFIEERKNRNQLRVEVPIEELKKRILNYDG